VQPLDEIVVKVDGKEYKVLVEEKEDGKILVHMGSDVYEVETKKDAVPGLEKLSQKKDLAVGESAIVAPLPGIVYNLKVKLGGHVKKGQSLMTLMAMKMENDIVSPKDGKVKELKVKKDDNVNKDDILIIIE
jgi:glutaconyl-CoA/methylmalonyl-CoA decarboxylase subunit gamma